MHSDFSAAAHELRRAGSSHGGLETQAAANHLLHGGVGAKNCPRAATSARVHGCSTQCVAKNPRPDWGSVSALSIKNGVLARRAFIFCPLLVHGKKGTVPCLNLGGGFHDDLLKSAMSRDDSEPLFWKQPSLQFWLPKHNRREVGLKSILRVNQQIEP
jgi:hypothetical protein